MSVRRATKSVKQKNLKVGDYLGGLGEIEWVEIWPDGTVHVDYMDERDGRQCTLASKVPDHSWLIKS